MNIDETGSVTVRSPLLINPPIDYTLTQDITTDWVWTLRPRVGLVAGNWMFFGSLGLAVSEINYDVDLRDTRSPPNVATGSFSDTKTGWAGGLGAAWAVNEQLSFTGEWLYLDLGEIEGNVTTPNGFLALESDGDIQANLLRVGMNWRFY
jgi:outer membrane immunogenic protein